MELSKKDFDRNIIRVRALGLGKQSLTENDCSESEDSTTTMTITTMMTTTMMRFSSLRLLYIVLSRCRADGMRGRRRNGNPLAKEGVAISFQFDFVF